MEALEQRILRLEEANTELKADVSHVKATSDMILTILQGDQNKGRDDHQRCQEMCVAARDRIHEKINLENTHRKIWEEDHVKSYHKFNPAWLIAAGSLVVALFALIEKFR